MQPSRAAKSDEPDLRRSELHGLSHFTQGMELQQSSAQDDRNATGMRRVPRMDMDERHATDAVAQVTTPLLQQSDDVLGLASFPLNTEAETGPRAFIPVAAARHGIVRVREIRQRRTRQALEPSAGIVPACCFRLLDDDISTTGVWYLQDSLLSPSRSSLSFDVRGPTHAHWGLAIWSQALQNPLLFKCLALLTLHKKRALTQMWDRVSYFQHKQDVYKLLRTQLRGDDATGASSASSNSNAVVPLATVVCLISFIEVMEGRFEEAAVHIRSVAALGDVAGLDATQWAFVAWNDLRYAMKMATPPVLPGSLPVEYLAQVSTACVNAAGESDSRRRALANWKHARTLMSGPGTSDALFEILQGVHSLSHLLPSSLVLFGAKLAKLYHVEHKLHTLAANAATRDEVRSRATATLFLVAMQLHVLELASSYAPSTPECRHFLLARACVAAQHLQFNDRADRKAQGDASLIWALAVLTIYSRQYTPRRHDGTHADDFIPALARLAADKDLRSRGAFLKLLQDWPEIAPWYTMQAVEIWSQLLMLRGKRWIQQVASPDATEESYPQRPQQPWFSGILMFYG